MTPVVLTPVAYEKVMEAAVADGFTPFGAEFYLQVGVQGGGCSGYSYVFELRAGNPDKKFQTWMQDELMLAVDHISAQYLKGTTIDYKTGLMSGFSFQNPNAKATCGCGSSFTT